MLFSSDIAHALNDSIRTHSPVSGGCINQTYKVHLASGKIVFVKENSNAPDDLFSSEAFALGQFSAAGTIRIPQVITHTKNFLVLEFIEESARPGDFYFLFGQELARHHQTATADYFGFPQDNYIGRLPQINTPSDSWSDFFLSCRLKPQAKLAGHFLSAKDLRSLDSLYQKLPQLLAPTQTDPACLLHGDLWGGNHFCDQNGQPVLFDPAAYYGDREADLAMTAMFAAYPKEFYQGYDSVYPVRDGFWQERIHIFLLYHYLSHVNHFGSSYLDGVRSQLAGLLCT